MGASAEKRTVIRSAKLPAPPSAGGRTSAGSLRLSKRRGTAATPESDASPRGHQNSSASELTPSPPRSRSRPGGPSASPTRSGADVRPGLSEQVHMSFARVPRSSTSVVPSSERLSVTMTKSAPAFRWNASQASITSASSRARRVMTSLMAAPVYGALGRPARPPGPPCAARRLPCAARHARSRRYPPAPRSPLPRNERRRRPEARKVENGAVVTRGQSEPRPRAERVARRGVECRSPGFHRRARGGALSSSTTNVATAGPDARAGGPRASGDRASPADSSGCAGDPLAPSAAIAPRCGSRSGNTSIGCQPEGARGRVLVHRDCRTRSRRRQPPCAPPSDARGRSSSCHRAVPVRRGARSFARRRERRPRAAGRSDASSRGRGRTAPAPSRGRP